MGPLIVFVGGAAAGTGDSVFDFWDAGGDWGVDDGGAVACCCLLAVEFGVKEGILDAGVEVGGTADVFDAFAVLIDFCIGWLLRLPFGVAN